MTMDYWIQTLTGKQVDLVNPKVDQICIEDITHALAMQCRFNGHSRYFYSVAQHSVHTAQHVLPDDKLWALLHDASEAYLGDVVSPLKRLLPDYMRMERAMMEAICEKFGLSKKMPYAVKEADLRMLATERRDFHEKPSQPWAVLKNIMPYQKRLDTWMPETARYKFRRLFDKLTGA